LDIDRSFDAKMVVKWPIILIIEQGSICRHQTFYGSQKGSERKGAEKKKAERQKKENSEQTTANRVRQLKVWRQILGKSIFLVKIAFLAKLRSI